MKYMVYKKHTNEGVRVFKKKKPAMEFMRRVRRTNKRHAKLGLVKWRY